MPKSLFSFFDIIISNALDVFYISTDFQYFNTIIIEYFLEMFVNLFVFAIYGGTVIEWPSKNLRIVPIRRCNVITVLLRYRCVKYRLIFDMTQHVVAFNGRSTVCYRLYRDC